MKPRTAVVSPLYVALENSVCATVMSEVYYNCLSYFVIERLFVKKTKRAEVMRSLETGDVLSRSAHCVPARPEN